MEDVLLTYPITIRKCIEVIKRGKFIINMLKNKKYDYCYYNNSGWVINSIFYTGFLKGNPAIKNCFIEHSSYSYTTDYMKKPFYLKYMIQMTGLKVMDGSMLKALYMFEPEWNCISHKENVLPMSKIDKNNKQILDAINKTFYESELSKQYLEKEIIVLEQPQMKLAMDKSTFWEKIFKVLNKKVAIIKRHPRQRQSDLIDLKIDIAENGSEPWEVELLNNNMYDKLLVSISSTSCISAKLMFDEEPYVLLLYKILPIDYKLLISDKLQRFFEKIGKSYTYKERFCIPESIEELEIFYQNFIAQKNERMKNVK